MSDLDFKFLEKNLYASEKDFKSLSGKFIKAINPVCTTSIRKKMVFQKIDYPIYQGDYCVRDQVLPEEELSLDLVVVPLFFFTQFGIRFFPKFEDEYYNQIDYLPASGTPLGKEYSIVINDGKLKPAEGFNFKDGTLQGLKVLESSNYHSLTYAGYEVETECKKSFLNSSLRNLTTELEIIPQFFVPFDMDAEFLISLALHVNLILH